MRRVWLLTNSSFPYQPMMTNAQAFLELTGYPVPRVLGRNCRFLQGPETDPVAIARMREAIDQGEDVISRVLNYRWDGTTFWNEVLISGIRDTEQDGGGIWYYLGLQQAVEVADPSEGVNEDDER
jgi:PAS domain-containing protein